MVEKQGFLYPLSDVLKNREITMAKRIFILAALGFALFAAPSLAENPDVCWYSYEETRNIQAKVAIGAPETDEPGTPKTVWVTAYSSTPEETDATPFITASQTEVRDGVIAANFLPIGTRVMIPELFGEKIFVVEDRMHRRKKNFVDIWMPSKEEARNFGIAKADIVILD